jgi:hypothetical protein
LARLHEVRKVYLLNQPEGLFEMKRRIIGLASAALMLAGIAALGLEVIPARGAVVIDRLHHLLPAASSDAAAMRLATHWQAAIRRSIGDGQDPGGDREVRTG